MFPHLLKVNGFQLAKNTQRSIPEATSILQTKQFALLSSISFLCLLSSTPNTTAVGIELAQEDAERFKTLLAGKETFKEAMRLFRKCGRGKQNAEEEEAE